METASFTFTLNEQTGIIIVKYHGKLIIELVVVFIMLLTYLF